MVEHQSLAADGLVERPSTPDVSEPLVIVNTMLNTVAVQGYRSLRELVVPLAPITVITGANGAGKSSLYRALRLLSQTASGRLVGAMAAEGGLERVLWAGPETVTGAMKRGEVPVQGQSRRRRPVSVMLGFATDELGYLIDIGLPQMGGQYFQHDPQIKRELVFAAPLLRPASTLVRRLNTKISVLDQPSLAMPAIDARSSMLQEVADPHRCPEVLQLRREVADWRFFDALRTDPQAPARGASVATWSPVLAEDGANLAATIATILEHGDADRFAELVAKALDGAQVGIELQQTELVLRLRQRGLLRALGATELSDGTLRLLMLFAILLSPRPPRLLVLNEPETSLHPEHLPLLAELMRQVSAETQIVVVSHAPTLVEALRPDDEQVLHHHLVKQLGQTQVEGQGLLTTPRWEWGSRQSA